MNDLPEPDGTHGIEIKTAPRQPLRRILRVAKKTVARLDIEQLSALGVREGDPWDASNASRILAAAQQEQVRRDALRLLNRRAYGSDELAFKLRTKGHDASAVESLIARLTEQRLLDDRAYGEAVIRSIRARGPAGDALLRRKLAAKRLPRDLVDRLIREDDTGGDPLDLARQAAEKKLRSASLQRCDPAARHRRVWNLLARKGFAPDTIRRAMADLPGLKGESEPF